VQIQFGLHGKSAARKSAHGAFANGWSPKMKAVRAVDLARVEFGFDGFPQDLFRILSTETGLRRDPALQWRSFFVLEWSCSGGCIPEQFRIVFVFSRHRWPYGLAQSLSIVSTASVANGRTQA
jgi:hypothetical protein